FFFQAEDGIRVFHVTGVQTCALPIFIGLFSLVINHYVLPWANIQKNELEAYTMNARKREQIIGSAPVSAQINVNEYIFIHSYNRSEEHTSELQSRENLVCRLLLAKKK